MKLATGSRQNSYEAVRKGQVGRLGYVVSVDGWRVTGILDSSAPEPFDGTAASMNGSDTLSYGSLVKIGTRWSTIYGIIGRIWIDDPTQPLKSAGSMVEIDLIGESPNQDNATPGMFQRGVSNYPELGAELLPVAPQDVAMIYAKPQASNVVVGTVHHGWDQPAYLITDSLLGKHFAILGTTGSGKSCSVALVLRSILAGHPNGHIVLLDPHNEYTNAFQKAAEVIAPDTLLLPFWLMNFEEAMAIFVSRNGSERDTEARILKEAILEARQEFAAHHGTKGCVTVDSPIPYYLRDVQQAIDARMGKLDKPDGAGPYLRLLARIDALLTDSRFSFMFADGVVEDAMPSILSRLVRVPVASKPITIVDLSGVPSEIVDVVVSMLCRMIFDFGVWSAQQHKVPILLVCEEAHRYVPRDESASFGPTRRAISRIAKEGRKYGVGLCLVSQRPSELSETILSQCNTIFAMRMSNHNDQEFVARALPDGMAGLVRALPALHTQEAIVVGEGVSVPTRLRFSDLDEAYRPLSGTAAFSRAWQDDLEGDSFILETIDHWRAQR